MPFTQSKVTLPRGDNICTLKLTHLIAQALAPSLENCEGIDWIGGMNIPTPDGVLPFKLSDSNRKKLRPLLKKLPMVRATMSDEEKESFLAAYRALDDKLVGEPYFKAKEEIHRQKDAAQQLDWSHQDVLRKKIEAGEISAYDGLHRPAKGLGYDIFISRSDAIAYLASINLFNGRTSAAQILADVLDTDDEKHPPQNIHTLDSDIPHLYKRVTGIGRIAIRAAWHIQCETKVAANANETYLRLIQWYRDKSPHAEGLLVGFDEKKRLLKWSSVLMDQDGTYYTLEGCKRHIEHWQTDFAKHSKK